MKCDRCGSFLKENENYDFHGKVLCVDCYFYETNPPKAFNPMAVSTALSIRKQLGQSGVAGLTEFQQRICSVIEQKGKVTKDELLEILEIKPEELETQFAILGHYELIRMDSRKETRFT